MSRLITGEVYSFDVKYVSGITWNKNTMRVLFKTGQYSVIEDVLWVEFVQVQDHFKQYLEENR